MNTIVKEVSMYVQLKKQGKKWIGLCPFHEEKTPSFTVDRDSDSFHCFGCNASGGVDEFYDLLKEHGKY